MTTIERLEALAGLCRSEGMACSITLDPGIRIVPKGPRWGGGRYLYLTGVWVGKVVYRAAKAEIDGIVAQREALSELAL